MAGSEDFKLDPITFNPYKALELSEDATPAQIKLAYRRLVLATHPDKIQDEAERQRRDGEFHNVQTAFDILRNEDRRRQWDERVKLANAWKAREQPTRPRRAQTQDYTPARPRYTPARYETYDGRMYEERVPKSSSRAYEEDFFSARFAESRPSPKKFDDRYADPPSRKTTGRGPDDRRASKESEVSRAKKEEAYLREQSKKKRGIEKKRGHADSIKKKATVEDDYSSESDADRYYSSSKSESRSKRRDYDSRNVRDVPIRSSKGFTYEDDDEELKPKVRGVEDYINKAESRGTPRRRADTYEERPAPPPSPPYSSYDYGRRSSGDDCRRSSGKTRSGREISPPRKSTKEKRLRDMVDPPSSPRTRVPNSSSDPRPLREMVTPSKSRGEPQRAATFQPEADFKKPPRLQRAETMPSKPSARREPTSSGSHLKRSTRPPPSDSESSDTSDSDSDATPIVESPAPRSRKSPPRPPPSTKQHYKVALDEESRSPRTVYIEPEEVYSSRDSSPRNPRRSSEHPPLPTRPAPSTRTQSVRSPYIPAESPVPSPRPSYTRAPSSRKAPPLQTQTSSRSSKPHLFGAVDEHDYSPKSSHHSPKASYSAPREESFSRRGSADKPFDDYPGSHSKSHRRPQRPAVY